MTRTERRRRRVLEMAIQQLPIYQRGTVRMVFYALKDRNCTVRGSKYNLELATAVLTKTIAAIDVLEG